jgi:nitroreductase
MLRKVKDRLVSYPAAKHVVAVGYHAYDALHTLRYMRWKEQDHAYWKMSSELIFQFHKLEKGLCLGGPPRFFGEAPAKATLDIVTRWRRHGLPSDDAVYMAAIETLRAYRRRLERTPPDAANAALPALLDACLASCPENEALRTPIPHQKAHQDSDAILRTLCETRRSVRAFRALPVPMEALRGSIAVAQLSPSACNRQPCKVHVYAERAKIDTMLALQNGNKGFGHTVPLLLVLTADATGFFGGSERNEPFLDGGLFLMTLLLSLQAKGLATCCLNWCVSPNIDAEGHRRGGIPRSERILTFLAVGYAEDPAHVPRSARRALETMLIEH